MNTEKLSQTLATSRQYAAILTAFMLPISTSGQAIAVSLFAVLALLTIDRSRAAMVFRTAPAYLPIVLFGLVLIGVAWSPLPLPLAIKWVGPYAKLLLIPLVMATTFTSKQALQISYGFLIACVGLLILSWVSILWPSGPWAWFKSPGVPVKDNAVQSGCFVLCAFGLALGAAKTWKVGDRRWTMGMLVLALFFFADLFVIYLSKTGVAMAAVLLGLFLLQVGGFRRALMIAVPVLAVVVVAVVISPPAQRRMKEILSDVHATQSDQMNQLESVSTASRIDFWTKSIEFVKQAPLFGHGTGSIQPLYQSLEATRPSPYGKATTDPHNQFFHTTLQVGLVGGAILIAMWIAHAVMFAQNNFASVIGMAVILQNIVGSLFNSHLSAVTQGMLYCLVVGLIGSLATSQTIWVHNRKPTF